MVKTPNPFPAGSTYTANFTIWSTKKHDRGQFNVYVGTTLLVSYSIPLCTFSMFLTYLHPRVSFIPQGTGNQYTSAAQETSTQRVFHRQKLVDKLLALPKIKCTERG